MASRLVAGLSAVLALFVNLLISPQESASQEQARNYIWDGSYSFADGQLIGGGQWRCLWLGYGTGKAARSQLWLQPLASTTLSETHSALVGSEFVLGASWNILVRVTTDRQLRIRKAGRKTVAAPNPWEVAWLIADMAADGSAGLYFIFKPNGVELGAYRGFGAEQIFLDTGSTPAMKIGTTYSYSLVKNSTMVTALVDGAPVAAAPLTALGNWSLGNRIGLYTEDAAVRFGPVTVTTSAP